MKQVRPKKNLGQHFLTDLNIAKAIADTVDACPEIPVLEVGPGMGVMTQFLVEKPRPFKVVEIDRESVAYLQEHFPRLSNNIIGGDFLRMDLREVFDGQQFVLTGNYPYDISSQIFFKMLDNKDLIPCCTGMIQHEVALRMASQPGNKQYGILSVLIQAWYHVEYLFTVEPGVFNPPPKVQSAVIRMTRNEVTDLGCDETLFRRVVKTVFNQRRKMLRVSLRQLFNGAQTASPHFFNIMINYILFNFFIVLIRSINFLECTVTIFLFSLSIELWNSFSIINNFFSVILISIFLTELPFEFNLYFLF